MIRFRFQIISRSSFFSQVQAGNLYKNLFKEITSRLTDGIKSLAKWINKSEDEVKLEMDGGMMFIFSAGHGSFLWDQLQSERHVCLSDLNFSHDCIFLLDFLTQLGEENLFLTWQPKKKKPHPSKTWISSKWKRSNISCFLNFPQFNGGKSKPRMDSSRSGRWIEHFQFWLSLKHADDGVSEMLGFIKKIYILN